LVVNLRLMVTTFAPTPASMLRYPDSGAGESDSGSIPWAAHRAVNSGQSER